MTSPNILLMFAVAQHQYTDLFGVGVRLGWERVRLERRPPHEDFGFGGRRASIAEEAATAKDEDPGFIVSYARRNRAVDEAANSRGPAGPYISSSVQHGKQKDK